jgi:hypothetical protein
MSATNNAPEGPRRRTQTDGRRTGFGKATSERPPRYRKCRLGVLSGVLGGFAVSSLILEKP